VAAKKTRMAQPLKHPKPPKLANERTGFNDKVANFIEVSDGNRAMNELIRRMAAERLQQQRVKRSVRMLTGAHQQQQ
jgi:hypothetical protein